MDTQSPILELVQLTKTYSKSHLGKVTSTKGVENLNFSIHPGEIFGLIGLNGAGKTTTFKLVLGLLFPTSGEVNLFGKNTPFRSAIQKVGFLPEIPYFPGHFTVREILEFYGRLSGIPEKELQKAVQKNLESVKMATRSNKKVKECSKGMLQRLSLAQALLHNPSFLILDEPITGLDPMGLNEMRQNIFDLNKQGKTILFSSHIISEVEKIAHRVGILVDGKLVQTLESKDWSGSGKSLEDIFVNVVQKYGDQDID